MKNTTLYITLFVALFLPVISAQAQEAAVPSVQEQLMGRAQYEQWTPQQWKALRTQILRSLKADPAQADPVLLQNVIYFATHYGDQIQLERAARRLLNIYEQSASPQLRLLALSALHAVGNGEVMPALARTVRFDESDTVRKVGIAVVADYYQQHH